MAEKKIIQIDSVDAYNKLYGWETLHPLVTVVNHPEPLVDMNHTRLNYGLYALFLKHGEGCAVRYGREKYDYQEGTIVTFKPGQVVTVEWNPDNPMPPSEGLLFHPDLIYGTPLGRAIHKHHATPMMDTIAKLREKYDLHMTVERYTAAETPETENQFIRK